jgi:hypothetical protein
VFFCDARGRAIFQDGYHRSQTERTVRATYGWANTSAPFPVKDMNPIVDESRLFTAAEITPAGGGNVQRVVNEAAALEFFEITRSLSTLHANATDALAFAHHIVNRYSSPLVRIPSLLLQPAAHSSPVAMWAAVLGHEISHRVKTIEKPIGTSVETPREHFVEGISHALSGSDWQVSIALSPAEIDGNYFIIGTDLIGSTTRLIGY